MLASNSGRCELVSRILSTEITWQQEVGIIFNVLDTNCDILLTSGCSMHVHVSPLPDGEYNTDQLRQILKGVIYYDTPFMRIMPAERKDNPWAEPNVKATPDWQNGVDRVASQTWAPLFDELDKPKMKAILLRGLCDNRYVAWNFSNILSACGTIEFRRPPGVKTSADASHWVVVALGFVAHTMTKQNWDEVKTTRDFPSTDDFRTAITAGVQSLGPNSQGALRSVQDVDQPPTPITAEELSKIEKKKKDKSTKPSIFVEKVRLLLFFSTANLRRDFHCANANN